MFYLTSSPYVHNFKLQQYECKRLDDETCTEWRTFQLDSIIDIDYGFQWKDEAVVKLKGLKNRKMIYQNMKDRARWRYVKKE